MGDTLERHDTMESAIPVRPSARERLIKSCKDRVKEIDDMFLFIDENIDYVKSAFALYDTEGDGLIPVCKLLTIFRTLGLNPTEDQYEDLTWDKNEDGYIDFIEFLKMMKFLWKDVDWRLIEAFYLFDSDGSGRIKLNDIRNVAAQFSKDTFTDEELDSMFGIFDGDGNGQIDYLDFANLLPQEEEEVT